jgi:hypothetical protein
MDTDEKRICKRCLMMDFAPEEYLENMRTYLNGLNEEVKADEVLYRSRLKQCKACDNLMDGICRLCGCFVEYRAAIRENDCPGSQPKW